MFNQNNDFFYKKYYKYKNKYNQLKNIGGSLVISKSNPTKVSENLFILNHDEKLKTMVPEYIERKRSEKFKIMLIVGSIPEQIDKFIIPPEYIPIFCEENYSFSNYPAHKSSIFTNLETKTFDDYPLIVCDVFSLGTTYPNIKFDLIIFDKGVCIHLKLNRDTLLILFDLTFDNNSLIIIDNISNMTSFSPHEPLSSHEPLIDLGSDLPFIKYFRKSISDVLDFDSVINTTILNLWFKNNFDAKLSFNFLLLSVLKSQSQVNTIFTKINKLLNNPQNKNKVLVFYVEMNLYFRENEKRPYLYFYKTNNYNIR